MGSAASPFTRNAFKFVQRLLYLDPARRVTAQAAKSDNFFLDAKKFESIPPMPNWNGHTFHEWETKEWLKSAGTGQKLIDIARLEEEQRLASSQKAIPPRAAALPSRRSKRVL